MIVADPEMGEVRRFLVGPHACEITGVITTPDQRTMFIDVQNPGRLTLTGRCRRVSRTATRRSRRTRRSPPDTSR